MKIILFSGLLLCISSCRANVTTPYWEIADPSLPDIAMIRMVRTGAAVVIYNPDTCQKIGAACGFFRTHAFAHDRLNHTILASPESYPLSMETQADCWAAKYGKPDEVYAAVQFFMENANNPNWKIHGDRVRRAENVRSCAIQVGNWIGK